MGSAREREVLQKAREVEQEVNSKVTSDERKKFQQATEALKAKIDIAQTVLGEESRQWLL